jgi:hypothetical protein
VVRGNTDYRKGRGHDGESASVGGLLATWVLTKV